MKISQQQGIPKLRRAIIAFPVNNEYGRLCPVMFFTVNAFKP